MAFYNIYFSEGGIEADCSNRGYVEGSELDMIESYIEIFKTQSYNPYPFSMMMSSVDHGNLSAPYCFTIFTFDYVINIALNADEISAFKELGAFHNHNNYQLTYVLNGSYVQKIENEQHQYKENDACLLKPHIYHSEDFSEDFTIITASVSQEYLENIYGKENEKLLLRLLKNDCIDFIYDSPYQDLDFTKNLKWYYSQAIELMICPAFANDTMIEVFMCKLIASLMNYPEYRRVSYRFDKNADFVIFEAITDMVKESYGRISRSELEERLHYSGSYLNKIVQRYSRMSISQYRNLFTMNRSAWLLKNTDKTISEICDELSIQNRTYFYKHFEEKYGMVPGKYRKKYHT